MTEAMLETPPGVVGLPLRTPTLPPATHTNCYIVGRARALVVDPGTPYDAERERLLERLYDLRGHGGNVDAVLLTHHHPDHVGAAARVAEALGVPVAAHPETLARVPLPRRLPRRELGEGVRLHPDDGLEVRLLHTPGHAPGHLCLHLPATGALIAGDMVPGVGTTLIDPTDGHMGQYIASLRRLAALDPAVVLPAHGPSRARGRLVIEQLIAHRLGREARVRDALGVAPRELAAIAADAYADTPAAPTLLAQRATLAHLITLEEAGHATRAPRGRWRRGPVG